MVAWTILFNITVKILVIIRCTDVHAPYPLTVGSDFALGRPLTTKKEVTTKRPTKRALTRRMWECLGNICIYIFLYSLYIYIWTKHGGFQLGFGHSRSLKSKNKVEFSGNFDQLCRVQHVVWKILAGQTWQRKSLSPRTDGQSWEAVALTVFNSGAGFIRLPRWDWWDVTLAVATLLCCAMIFPDAFHIWVAHDTHKLDLNESRGFEKDQIQLCKSFSIYLSLIRNASKCSMFIYV